MPRKPSDRSRLLADYLGADDIIKAGIPQFKREAEKLVKTAEHRLVAKQLKADSLAGDTAPPNTHVYTHAEKALARAKERTRERDIETYLKDVVAKAGGITFKTQFIGVNGAPDRLVLLPEGRSTWVELKAPGKKPTPQQKRLHAQLTAFGQRVEVFDSFEIIDAFMAGRI